MQLGFYGLHILCMLGHTAALKVYISTKADLEVQDRVRDPSDT